MRYGGQTGFAHYFNALQKDQNVQRWLLLGAALLVGAMLPTQAAINAQLRQFVGGPFRSGLVSVCVSTLAMVLIVALNVGVERPVSLGGAPWWVWIGGLLGIVVVLGSLMLAPRLGAATLFAGVICGQLIASLVLDHFGLLGYAVSRATPTRLLGVALLFVALFLIQRK
jgi:transporter family-2 protein